MKQYKVLKDFPSSDGGYIHELGTTYKPTQSETRTENLLKFGFIEEIPEQPKTVWDLERGDNFWFINADDKSAYVSRSKWHSTYEPEREIGDVFLTKEEAEKELARRKAKVILERDTKGFKPDWSNGATKWGVYYDYVHHELNDYHYSYKSLHRDLWFATKEDAEESIKNHEKEWLCYLNIEDAYDKSN